ncbi:MAG: hypothetical protein GQ582_11095, partial [Methyloprofundus sp.]|nr:hypothetical protein [Methyloprofundus sp.]
MFTLKPVAIALLSVFIYSPASAQEPAPSGALLLQEADQEAAVPGVSP